ncbi:MAG TPA: LysM peptidoglycan-binding domain-containing protein [Aggregatilineales bacterium]|nr:LysM peptidoglycan-binding domain-containing protein [Aggregatilineales bacterium]
MRGLRTISVTCLSLLLAIGIASARDNPHGKTLLTATVSPSTTPTPANEETHVVRQGETLFRIALRYNISVSDLAAANGITNPALIYAGQTLRIPGQVAPTATATRTSAPPTATPNATATPVPPPTTSYTVQRGDTLLKIASRFETTVNALLRLNRISNPNLIFVGQQLQIPASTGIPAATLPAGTSLPATVVPTSVSDQENVESTEAVVAAPITRGYGFAFGIEAFMLGNDSSTLTSQASAMGMQWVKQEVAWSALEPVKGELDFSQLDEVIDALNEAGINILLTVRSAPRWAFTPITLPDGTLNPEAGPPDNAADFEAFMTALVSRYAGRVQAYEIWNEPNLRREWNSATHPLGASSYIDLLRTGYTAVKANDAAAVVISAGLAPTGYFDASNAQNDRLFLQELYELGLAEISDAIGAHPLGWSNPPDAFCCAQPVGVEGYYQDSSFYFRETLQAYRDIVVTAGDSSTPIWVTKFGWGTSQDTYEPSPTNIYVSWTTLGEQAIYNTRAFELGRQFGYIGPMFLYNLNGCGIQSPLEEVCFYGMFDLNGQERPSFAAIRDLITPPIALPEVSPTPGS